MSPATHPIAARLEALVGGDAKLLATVMGLPLVDGIFPALVLAGALDGPLNVLQVGLLVFGGSATVAVVLAEMDGTRRETVTTVAAVGIGIVALATVEAALAPTIESVLDIATFERAAALVVLAVAAKTASARVGEYLPRPAVVVGLGLLVSLDLSDPRFEVVLEPELVAAAAAAAAVGAGFALAVAVAGPHLRRRMDVDRFRFGSAVALGLLALSILGLQVGSAPLAVVGVAALFALEPGCADDCPDEPTRDSTAHAEAAD
ncbi:DUF5794 domain-containing protein [Haloarchaeobius litoreus]|uniref:DUF5794 domain-containing protein n=1 Tax=Haloarchaeobius litoreus TaxID=755306 RepID=A0ABD6DH11_9EURY|nr:DUF5794 domain-containing protein [Haloarchaeobius litoreus]